MRLGGSFGLQNLRHFAVTYLMEILIELADCKEIFGGFEANNFVSVAAQRLETFGRRDRHGKHQPLGFLTAYTAQRSSGRGTGRDSIVDHNHGLACERDLWPAAAVRSFATMYFLELARNVGVFIFMFDAE